MRTHGPVTYLDDEQLVADPIYVQRLGVKKTPWLSYPRLQGLNYYLRHHQPDILHAYSFWYQPADTAARYARDMGIPFIFHPIYYENEVRSKPIWRLYRHTRGRATFAAADVVVVISEHERDLICAAKMPAKKFLLVPPGVDIAGLNTPLPDPFRARGINGRVLLTVNRLAPGKGLADIVKKMPELVRQHHDVQLVLVGEDFGAEDELKKLSAAGEFGNNIHFVGKLNRNELIAAYQHATVLVHTSHYEAFGIVLAEAQAAGLPVIARAVGAVPSVVHHQSTGLLFNNPQEMAAHISQLLSEDATLKLMAAAARRHAADNFAWDKSIKRLLALYEQYK